MEIAFLKRISGAQEICRIAVSLTIAHWPIGSRAARPLPALAVGRPDGACRHCCASVRRLILDAPAAALDVSVHAVVLSPFIDLKREALHERAGAEDVSHYGGWRAFLAAAGARLSRGSQ
jgi:hypothetical protein